VNTYYSLDYSDTLDDYDPRPATDEECFNQTSGETYCPVEMQVSYIKKSKPPEYQLIYSLTPTFLSYFNEDDLENGELKRFI
jgi:hypothetical protein